MLSAEAKDLISKLLCNVEQRLGTKGADEIKVVSMLFFFSKFYTSLDESVARKHIVMVLLLHQAHPWFKGIEWDNLYRMEAAFIPEVKDELDTQNFEKFEEV